MFPLIEGEEFKTLVKDVKARGIINPIIVYRGKVHDSRNRYWAAIAAGVTPRSGLQNLEAALIASLEIPPRCTAAAFDKTKRDCIAEANRRT